MTRRNPRNSLPLRFPARDFEIIELASEANESLTSFVVFLTFVTCPSSHPRTFLAHVGTCRRDGCWFNLCQVCARLQCDVAGAMMSYGGPSKHNRSPFSGLEAFQRLVSLNCQRPVGGDDTLRCNAGHCGLNLVFCWILIKCPRVGRLRCHIQSVKCAFAGVLRPLGKHAVEPCDKLFSHV